MHSISSRLFYVNVGAEGRVSTCDDSVFSQRSPRLSYLGTFIRAFLPPRDMESLIIYVSSGILVIFYTNPFKSLF